jgi:hypothetical protein
MWSKTSAETLLSNLFSPLQKKNGADRCSLKKKQLSKPLCSIKNSQKKPSKEEDDEKKNIFQDNIIQLTHFILLKKI